MDGTTRSRCEALRRLLWPGAGVDHGADSPALQTWARALVEEPEDLQGVSLEGLSTPWIEALAYAGVPLTAQRGLPFNRLFVVEDVPAPRIAPSGPLILPPADRLKELTSLPMKPLRMAMAGVFGIRLQIGTGVHLFVGRHRAILLNTSAIPRSGFLHGPRRGMRAALAMEPSEAQTVSL